MTNTDERSTPLVSPPRLRWMAYLLGAVVCARLASLAFYPLTDATEARYANIARVMLESGDWITPQTAPGSVFWGKPPLYAWASAASMGLLGVNEFGARLPSFLFGVATLLVVHGWAFAVAARAGRERPGDVAVAAALVAATCIGFFVSSGAVMTDAPLIFAVTWALTSFWIVAVGRDSRWRWRFGFFAALGIGMLAKGPVGVVLVAAPVFGWCLIHRRWADLRFLPWLSGTFLAAAISGPWYIAAELKTPGFLRYFILGENFKRFLVPGWKGDLYGFTHEAPHGIVWLYFVAATLPWSLAALPAAVAALSRARKTGLPGREISFVALAALAPLVFFSLSSHLIWTYALPAIPPFAVLMGLWLTAPATRSAVFRYASLAAGVVAIAAAGVLVAASSWLADNHSTREIYRVWETAQASVPGPLVFEQRQVVPSLLFYSNGAARSNVHEDDETATHYGIYTSKQAGRFAGQPPECKNGRAIVARIGAYVLVREAGMPKHCDVE
jgi:4-amino-4-deoxy-L-arabinose transferase-like glycosyltransferase